MRLKVLAVMAVGLMLGSFVAAAGAAVDPARSDRDAQGADDAFDWGFDADDASDWSVPLGLPDLPAPTQQFPVDHFKCYRATTSHAATPSETFEPRVVTVFDQFGNETVEVIKPATFCNPVQKNNETIINFNNHLTCYGIRDVHGQPRFVKRFVTVFNQFGAERLYVTDPQFLCVPTQKFPLGPPQGLDHYKCYRVREPDRTFVPRQVLLRDQFEAKQTEVLKPAILCNPASKNGSPVFNPQIHQVCYKIRDARDQPVFQGRTILVLNQFGLQRLDLIRPSFLCVPSFKQG